MAHHTCEARVNRPSIIPSLLATLGRAVVALAALVAVAPDAPADSELSMQDLQALDRQNQWTELLDSASRVKPAARTADWARLVTAAATRVVERIAHASASGLRQASSLITIVPAAEHRYTFLVGDAGYLDAKGKALAGVAAACGRERLAGCGAIVASLADGVARFPSGTARAIALLVADDLTPADSVHFWALAADDDRDVCKHPLVGRAVVQALRAAQAPAQVADAQRAATTCFAQLEQTLVEELVATKDTTKDRPLYLRNACPVLKTHGPLTIAKKKKCP
jgi:hypothetical protein